MEFKNYFKDGIVGTVIKTFEKIDKDALVRLEKYTGVTELKDPRNSDADILIVLKSDKPPLYIELVVYGTLCFYEKNCIFVGGVKSLRSGDKDITPDTELSFQFDYYSDMMKWSLLHLFYDGY